MTLSSLGERLVKPAPAGPAGVWRLDGDGFTPLAGYDVGPAIVLVPAEQVLLLAVDLPLASPRRRLESLPFAVEDLVAARTDTLHMAIGAELAPHRYLVGIVDHDVMRRWTEALLAAELGHCMLVPDALALPRPGEGEWCVDIDGERAVVRADDGTGFAVPASQLAAAWAAGGRKRLLASGDALPEGLAAAPAPAAPSIAERLRVPPLDLRQGIYARRRAALPAVWRRVAIVAAAGLAAHTGIAAADTLMLSHIAAKREAETRALLSASYPAAATSTDLVGEATALLPVASGAPGTFLPLVTQASNALAPLGAGFALQALRYDAATGRLTLDIHAADAAMLDRATAALQAAGLSVSPGPARADSDGYVRTAVVQGPRA